MQKYIFKSPSRYIQGNGVIEELGKETEAIGKKPLLLSDEVVWDITKDAIENSFKDSDSDFHFEEFNGEASTKEIDRLVELGKDKEADAVIGVGGGKTLDTAKAVSDALGVPVIIVPTTASTDAPTSALSVIYSDDGVFEDYKFYDKNPDLVLIDTGIVVKAPLHLFASGMSDAMATLVEVRAAMKRNGDTMAGGKTTFAAKAIAEMAEEVLFTHGLAAYQAVKEKLVTPQVDAIVEANTLLSGLGFENGGLAGAHAIHNGFTAVDGEIHDLTHGQKVAYGVLVQLVLERKSGDEIKKYIDFFKAIDMPTTLKDIHLDEKSFDELIEIGELATADGETMENLDPEITPVEIAHAILAVNELSKA
ncbi:Glycerol dehydrogenase [Alkalibacterium sp. AK22]|uniref:glycerol dehydrogenase n=1 Tax=Alkalibacterium sp. AK22 TaxID=1229520 RepID=UPI00044B5F62|nr:glycerol dehydrogenase [Alkalibacterium sp. AK22]EXJ24481.1 Glycerol dehydrogenase [Alkalibacterium sp. AK22]